MSLLSDATAPRSPSSTPAPTARTSSSSPPTRWCPRPRLGRPLRRPRRRWLPRAADPLACEEDACQPLPPPPKIPPPAAWPPAPNPPVHFPKNPNNKAKHKASTIPWRKPHRTWRARGPGDEARRPPPPSPPSCAAPGGVGRGRRGADRWSYHHHGHQPAGHLRPPARHSRPRWRRHLLPLRIRRPGELRSRPARAASPTPPRPRRRRSAAAANATSLPPSPDLPRTPLTAIASVPTTPTAPRPACPRPSPRSTALASAPGRASLAITQKRAPRRREPDRIRTRSRPHRLQPRRRIRSIRGPGQRWRRPRHRAGNAGGADRKPERRLQVQPGRIPHSARLPVRIAAAPVRAARRSQIGVVQLRSSAAGGTRTFGVFNLQPPPGSPRRSASAPMAYRSPSSRTSASSVANTASPWTPTTSPSSSTSTA